MSDQNEVKNLIDPDALPIVSTGKSAAQPKHDFETIAQDAGAGVGGSEIYDRYMKLLYVIDNSGSMDEGMAVSETPERYEWSDEILAAFRRQMREYLQEVKEDNQSEGEEEEAGMLWTSVPDNDEELKQLIVDANLMDEFPDIDVPKKRYGGFGKAQSKIEMVKDAARGFVEKRFAKYPEANVMLFGFDDSAYVLGRGISKDEVLNAIDKLDASGGNTRIVSAVRTAIGECKKRPSEVGAHHLVLVTDGYDNDPGLMTDLLDALLELHIVLDFIFVMGQSDEENNAHYKQKIDAIKLVCEKTHGEYMEVQTVEDFQQKFLSVSNRPMLPWK
jgi:hypothetical protein